jgi:hypothetical protein
MTAWMRWASTGRAERWGRFSPACLRPTPSTDGLKTPEGTPRAPGLVKICDLVLGVRVAEEPDVEGLDLSMHGEEG